MALIFCQKRREKKIMKAKDIILVGIGVVAGFVSCSILVIKTILRIDKMRDALKQIICDRVEWILYGETPQSNNRSRVSYQSYYNSEGENK